MEHSRAPALSPLSSSLATAWATAAAAALPEPCAVLVAVPTTDPARPSFSLWLVPALVFFSSSVRAVALSPQSAEPDADSNAIA